MALLTVLVVTLRQNKPHSSGTPALPKVLHRRLGAATEVLRVQDALYHPLHLIWFTVFTGQSAVALTNYHCGVVLCSAGLCPHNMTMKTINTATDDTLGHGFSSLYSSLCHSALGALCLTSTPPHLHLTASEMHAGGSIDIFTFVHYCTKMATPTKLLWIFLLNTVFGTVSLKS